MQILESIACCLSYVMCFWQPHPHVFYRQHSFQVLWQSKRMVLRCLWLGELRQVISAITLMSMCYSTNETYCICCNRGSHCRERSTTISYSLSWCSQFLWFECSGKFSCPQPQLTVHALPCCFFYSKLWVSSLAATGEVKFIDLSGPSTRPGTWACRFTSWSGSPNLHSANERIKMLSKVKEDIFRVKTPISMKLQQ